jgi:hypothetical protein
VIKAIPDLNYLGFNIVIVTWFTVEASSCLLEDDSVSGFNPRQKPGFLGCGSDAVSLLSIKTTEDIVGLSSARSWTHKSPTCMHLNTSDSENESPTDESIMSNARPSFHNCQACNVQFKVIYFFVSIVGK